MSIQRFKVACVFAGILILVGFFAQNGILIIVGDVIAASIQFLV